MTSSGVVVTRSRRKSTVALAERKTAFAAVMSRVPLSMVSTRFPVPVNLAEKIAPPIPNLQAGFTDVPTPAGLTMAAMPPPPQRVATGNGPIEPGSRP
jgi:hypothetical protein